MTHSIRGFAFGDIVMRPGVGVPLVVIDDHRLDDGSGECAWVFFADPSYQRVGSVFGDAGLLAPLLAYYGKQFNKTFYESVQSVRVCACACGVPETHAGERGSGAGESDAKH